MGRIPSFTEEEILWQQGFQLVAGIDEVGRGPLAGPVVAAAVVFPPYCDRPWLDQLRDSKILTAARRTLLADFIKNDSIACGIGVVHHDQVDTINILEATKLAMRKALDQLIITPDVLLIDALTIPGISTYQKPIIKGDAISRSIAAASIVAKVHRDMMMAEYDLKYPGYGFSRNAGYGTREHMEALNRIGCCPIHRTTFAPVRKVLQSSA